MSGIGWLHEDGPDEWRISRIDPWEAGEHDDRYPSAPVDTPLPFPAWEPDASDTDPPGLYYHHGTGRTIVTAAGPDTLGES